MHSFFDVAYFKIDRLSHILILLNSLPPKSEIEHHSYQGKDLCEFMQMGQLL